jgi:phospholipid transport system transporter-binding protein
MAARPDSGAIAGGGAALRRDGDALVFSGPLLRSDIATLWAQARQAMAGVRRFDLRAVVRIDSAGLAFLAQLTALGDGAIAIDGAPAGLAELSAAYRLSPSLAFAT